MTAWFETFRGVVHPWMCDQFGLRLSVDDRNRSRRIVAHQ
jgi:YD repeat-containing protein